MIIINNSLILGESFIFLALIYLVYKYIYPRINNVILQRQSLIQATISNRKESEQILNSAIDKSSKIINAAHKKYDHIIEDAKKQANNLNNEIAIKYRKKLEIEQKDIINQTKRTISELNNKQEEYILKNAIFVAKKILSRELTKDDHLKIIQQMIDEIN